MRKQKNKYDRLSTGLLLALAVPLIAVLILWILNLQDYSLTAFVMHSIRRQVITHLISICVLPNLGLFFFFLYKNYLQTVRGILGGTMFWAFLVLILKLTLFNG